MDNDTKDINSILDTLDAKFDEDGESRDIINEIRGDGEEESIEMKSEGWNISEFMYSADGATQFDNDKAEAVELKQELDEGLKDEILEDEGLDDGFQYGKKGFSAVELDIGMCQWLVSLKTPVALPTPSVSLRELVSNHDGKSVPTVLPYNKDSEVIVDALSDNDNLPPADVDCVLNSSRNSKMENNEEAGNSNNWTGDETTMDVDLPEYSSIESLEGVVNASRNNNEQIQSPFADPEPSLHGELHMNPKQTSKNAHLLRELQADYKDALEENDILAQANAKYECEIKDLKDTMWNKDREIAKLCELNRDYLARIVELEEEIEGFGEACEEEKRKRRKEQKKVRRLEKKKEKLKAKVICQRLKRESRGVQDPKVIFESTGPGNGDIKFKKNEPDSERQGEIMIQTQVQLV